MSQKIVTVTNLCKNFGIKNQTLKNLNLKVSEGVVYGLLGQNGAGKSTTIRILMNLLKPTSGSIQVFGSSPDKLDQVIRQKIGYTSDTLQLVPWLKVYEALNYNGSFYDNWDDKYVMEWLKRLDLSLDKRIFQLSKGQKQKLSLIMAIGHKPQLLILDEPMGGLDPIARKDFLEYMIHLLQDTGTTILISSHLISDLEKICDWIGIIEKGQMKVESSLDELKQNVCKVKLVSDEPIHINHPSLLHSENFGNMTIATFKNWTNHLKDEVKKQFPSIKELKSSHMSLEEIFVAYANS